jgi:hypothetical protein
MTYEHGELVETVLRTAHLDQLGLLASALDDQVQEVVRHRVAVPAVARVEHRHQSEQAARDAPDPPEPATPSGEDADGGEHLIGDGVGRPGEREEVREGEVVELKGPEEREGGERRRVGRLGA